MFEPFATLHAALLAAVVGLTVAAGVLGRRYRGRPWTGRLEAALALANLAAWALVAGYRLWPPRFDPAVSLPLHLSDLISPLASAALLSGRRPLRALVYFWGVGLSSQALLTPDLVEGPDSPWFWAFWLQHGFIIGVAGYLLLARGFRPGWRDLGWAVAAGLAYLAVVLPVNLGLDANYGYLGRGLPAQPSLLDLLGPWPQRVGVMVVLALAGMLLLLLPWRLARPRRRLLGGAG